MAKYLDEKGVKKLSENIKTYVEENGGKIDKITQNGQELPIENKTVNIESSTITLNGNKTNDASIYSPTIAGEKGQVPIANENGIPEWSDPKLKVLSGSVVIWGMKAGQYALAQRTKVYATTSKLILNTDLRTGILIVTIDANSTWSWTILFHDGSRLQLIQGYDNSLTGYHNSHYLFPYDYSIESITRYMLSNSGTFDSDSTTKRYIPTVTGAYDMDSKRSTGFYILDNTLYVGDKPIAKVEDIPAIPTKTSELENDSNFATTEYVDNNLTNYTLAVNTASSIEMSIDDSTYVVSLKLKNEEGTQLGETQTIDLPLESVVVNGAYDSTTKEVILTLDNGNEVRFSVADLVNGLATTNDLNNYLPKTGGTLTAISGDTALHVQSKSTASYIGFKDSNGSLLGYYGVNSLKKPVFYNGGDKVLAYASDIPDVSVFAKTSDIPKITLDGSILNIDL